jgi:hypothetical protein
MRPTRFVLLAAAAFAISSCAPAADTPSDQSGLPVAEPARSIYLSPVGFDADLKTPAGIHVKTNGQYKTPAQKSAAAAAIDRYWLEVRQCSMTIVPSTGEIARLLLEFPLHLSIEIANDWKVVEGPTTHRKMQAFPSRSRPGTWSTARREEDALFILVVPELNGLAPQVAGELNLWLAGNTSALATDLSNACSLLKCIRFNYDNAPSQAFTDCID